MANRLCRARYCSDIFLDRSNSLVSIAALALDHHTTQFHESSAQQNLRRDNRVLAHRDVMENGPGSVAWPRPPLQSLDCCRQLFCYEGSEKRSRGRGINLRIFTLVRNPNSPKATPQSGFCASSRAEADSAPGDNPLIGRACYPFLLKYLGGRKFSPELSDIKITVK